MSTSAYHFNTVGMADYSDELVWMAFIAALGIVVAAIVLIAIRCKQE